MTTPTHSVSTIGRGAIWSVLNQLIGQILSLLVFLIVARFVSKEDFGIMATCMIAVEVFRQFLIETMGGTIYSRKNADDHDYTAGFYIIAAAGAFAALIVFAFAHPLAQIFDYDNIATTLQWISAILLVGGLSKMHEIWLIKHLQFKKLAIRSIITISIGGGIGIYMAIHGYGLASLIAQQLITSIANMVFLWGATPWRPTLEIRWDRLRSIIHHWKYMALSALAGMSDTQGDVFFSSYYLGPVMTGIYNAAKRLAAALSMITGGIHSVAFPTLTSMSHSKESFQKAFLTLVTISSMATAPLYTGISIMSPDIIAILLGPKWIEVVPVLSILVISGYMSTVSRYNTFVMLIEHKPHLSTIIGYINAATNIAILIIFAQFGLITMALAIMVKNMLFFPVTTHLALGLLDNLKWKSYLRSLLPSITFSLLMGAFVAYAKDMAGLSPILNLIVFVPTGALLYFSFYYIFDRKTFMQAYGMVIEIVRKKKNP